tara:strand:- start:339 stop:1046 length:708 start_codon:yes stop_codon:yes gene_type:complete
MFSRLTSEYRLYRHNRNNRKGIVDEAAQAFFFLPDVLAPELYARLLARINHANGEWNRSSTTWRDGGAIGGHALKTSAFADCIPYFSSGEFLQRLRERTGKRNLQFVPNGDTNRLSLLSYSEPGDGIDWHVDGNIYLGERWAGILTLLENTHDPEAKLELRPSGQTITLPIGNIANSLVLFRGDHVQHRVRPIVQGEKRVVMSLLFSTDPTMTINPLLRRYQSRVNQVFYGNGAL